MVLGRNVCSAGLILDRLSSRTAITAHYARRHQELAVHCRQVSSTVRRAQLLQCLLLMYIAAHHDWPSLQATCRPMQSQHVMCCSM